LLFRGNPCKPGDPPGPYAEGFAKPLSGGRMQNGIKEESQRWTHAEEQIVRRSLQKRQRHL
jgi:hypothetical protein